MKPRKWNLTKNVQLLFEPADLWVGFFWDRVKRQAYVLPVPCVGLVFQFAARKLRADFSVIKKKDESLYPVGDVRERAPFPHCDERVLHSPGRCEVCDEYPEAQRKRVDERVNFTGEAFALCAPCPSDAARGLAGAHVWHGNRPKKG